MVHSSLQQENSKDDIDRQMEYIIAGHTISDLETQGKKGVPELIRYMAHPLDEVAQEAIFMLKRIVPLAAMLQRWDDDSPVFPQNSGVLPQWIIEASSGWGTQEDFATQCAEEFLKLEADSHSVDGETFLRRMVLFPGAQRRFAQVLSAAGKNNAVTLFDFLVQQQQDLLFPAQIALSPTMNCQLHCDYCVSAGHQQLKEAPLPLLMNVLDWAEKNDIRRIGFCGGEPTLYTDFGPLVDTIISRGFDYYIATNGIIPSQALKTMCLKKPGSLTLHLTPEVFEGRLFKTFMVNAHKLRKAEVPLLMRLNFTHRDMDIGRYFDVAAEIGAREVRAAVPMPNSTRYNSYIAVEQLPVYGQILAQYIQEGLKHSIQTSLSRPFPLCQIPEETAKVLLSNGSVANNCPVHMRKYSNNVLVMPDGTCIPCLGLNRNSPLPISEYDTLEEVGNLFKKEIQRVTLTPLLDTCSQCPFWCGGRCIGGCLSYRLTDETEKKDV